jgi:NAD(P)-dependent dehydrogenase (short-subunit alcohol dehydrogenase family)
VRALNLPLDIVICNAGIVGASTLEQVDGIEKQFAVNHLSHFILVNRLLDLVKAAPQGRIVMVSSEAHKSAPKAGIEFDNLAGTRAYGTFKMYGQSKLANHLMTRELAKRLAGSNATVNSIHPGVVKTNIFNNMTGFTRWLLDTIGGLFMKTVEAGAATMCYVATSPALAKVNGGYFSHCNPAPTTANAQSDTLAAKLWTVSEDMTRKYL